MCGIAGIIGLQGSDDVIRSMTSAIAHRGPDADGYWSGRRCTLGHRRLSILDLSVSANQPMISHCGRFVMVYNGEIYNFKDIEKSLGITMKTTSDSEVILEAFVKWGTEFVHRLNGMFVIAIWDSIDEKLFIFRDRLGIKPLFIFQDTQIFAFASELKALTAHPCIRKTIEIDNQSIGYFLHLGYIPQPNCIYKQIHKFPQGSYGVLHNGQLKIQQYWSVESQIQEFSITDEYLAKEQLKSLLIDSVQRRLMSDVPYGTFLSGGIDSSLVTAIAQSVNSSPLNTFSIGLNDSAFDESSFARKIAHHLGTNHHEFILDENDARRLLPDLDEVYDEPFADSSAVPTMLVSKMAKQHVTMTLSGDGGDELFFGYGAYKWAERLQKPIPKIFHKGIGNLLQLGSSKMRRASWVFNYRSIDHVPAHIFSQEQYLFSQREISQMHGISFVGSIFNEFEQLKLNRKLKPAEKQALFDLKYYLPDDLLVKVDRASMHYSLETRVPLLDYRIVEFALNLDPSLKFKNGISKHLLKQVLFDYVPAIFFNRPKQGFAIPLAKWMRSSMKEYVLDYVYSEKLQSLLKRNTDEIPAMKKWKSGDDLYYNRIWQLVVLAKWLHR